MPATMTTGNSRPLAACIDISQTRASVGAFGLVGFGQERQAIDEAAERRVGFARSRTPARPTPVPSGFRCAPRLPRCARRADPGDSRIDRASRPRVVDTLAPAASSASDAIRSRNAVSAASARGGSSRRSSATRAAPRAIAATALGSQAGGEAAACRHRSSTSGSTASSASMHRLPMPRAGTLTTRRKLTSSCGLMSEAQVGERVLDLLALVEPDAADDAVGDALAHQRVFDRARLRVGAVEHGDHAIAVPRAGSRGSRA